MLIAEAVNAIPTEPPLESQVDVLIEMDKIKDFMETGRCEVYDNVSAERIAKHLYAHGEKCTVEISRNQMVGDCWLIRRIK
jgi:hypothetical protein